MLTELLYYIFSFLHSEDLLSTRLVNKRYNDIITSSYFWKQRLGKYHLRGNNYLSWFKLHKRKIFLESKLLDKEFYFCGEIEYEQIGLLLDVNPKLFCGDDISYSFLLGKNSSEYFVHVYATSKRSKIILSRSRKNISEEWIRDLIISTEFFGNPSFIYGELCSP